MNELHITNVRRTVTLQGICDERIFTDKSKSIQIFIDEAEFKAHWADVEFEVAEMLRQLYTFDAGKIVVEQRRNPENLTGGGMFSIEIWADRDKLDVIEAALMPFQFSTWKRTGSVLLGQDVASPLDRTPVDPISARSSGFITSPNGFPLTSGPGGNRKL